MKKIFCVSYPRSGSRYLAKCLELTMRTAGLKYGYCDKYDFKIDLKRHTHIKTHDFQLADTIPSPNSDWFVMFQIRNPCDAINSFFYLNVKKDKLFKNTGKQFDSMLYHYTSYWNRLVVKWVAYNVHILKHEDFMRDPEQSIARVLEGIGACARPILRKQREPTSFANSEHYSKEREEYIRNRCASGMKILGYE